jgi:glyoxylase-like metal-dependent hydrolase (beta-lactamase superfamily II)
MIFRQLFDAVSGTYTYLLASRRGGEALIIDPVIEKVDRYLQLVNELDLRLVKAVDTHMHADHVTGLGALRDRTHCITVMGEQTKADVVSMRVAEGDQVKIEGVALDVLYTPGHTDDSYSYLMGDRVFTGDTLLIRGTGRTDFQNGDSRAQYDSIFNKLLKLSEETLVFPAHDYKGETVSTIGEEKRFNPRLQVKSIDEYVEVMSKLKLPNPKMMDVAIPSNMRVGMHQEEIARRGWALSARDATRSSWWGGRTSRWSICARTASGRSTGRSRDPCTCPTPRWWTTCGPAACCINSRPIPASASCSIAPSASARPWRCRQRRTRDCCPRSTSRAAWMPGRRRAGRWRAHIIVTLRTAASPASR